MDISRYKVGSDKGYQGWKYAQDKPLSLSASISNLLFRENRKREI